MDAFDLVAQPRPRVGISACLLGEPVRFDGGHKRDSFLAGTLGRFVEWVPVCPEMEAGLGAPRPALRLARETGGVRLVESKSGRDRTGMVAHAVRDCLTRLEGIGDLYGFVLKKDSPTCGLERVRVYGPGSLPARSGRGLFADALAKHFPLLPLEEEGRLRDARLRANFIERVFAYQRLTALFASTWTTGQLVRFHTAHKLLLMAHDPGGYASIGRLVSTARALSRTVMREQYSARFMAALSTPPTRGRHVNVLHHMLGYFRRLLDHDSREELLSLIVRFAGGLAPLAVPLALFEHHIRRCGVTYLAAQTYLTPCPRDLVVESGV